MGALETAHEASQPLDIVPDRVDISICPAGGRWSQVVVVQGIKAACELLLGGMRKSNGGFRTHSEMVAENIPTKYNGKWTATADQCDTNSQVRPFSCYMYGVFLTEVAVDITTCQTTVKKMTLAADIGKIANRLAVHGQMFCGMAKSIGVTLSEDFEDIKKHSNMVSAGFPHIKQIPDNMELFYVESPRL